MKLPQTGAGVLIASPPRDQRVIYGLLKTKYFLNVFTFGTDIENQFRNFTLEVPKLPKINIAIN